MTPAGARGVVRSAVDLGITGFFAAWFVVTVLAQHPDRAYDRVRRLDAGVGNAAIPNWRFFAPKPAVEDVHYLYRLADDDRSRHSEWRSMHTISTRRMGQALWFPGRRKEKGFFDVANVIMTVSPDGPPALARSRQSAMESINDAVRATARPEDGMEWFQVMMLRYAGHDASAKPEYDVVFDYARFDEEGAP
ncbi:hypothetical protein FGG90_13080 [Clavibacter tessellarius]|uniref:Uncharacterized protein n=1 Tax=Clavibacter tessellarius TaxID=31965 RepID=A0A225C6H2_9MICO|nr:hypothetical protein [Clavibacter michiganensis]MBT1635159.1 hypothetical protein [Clavibacter michiganensis]OQJ62169.1 hypothetical protein B5P24_03625 [Clavibacter michiganensis subsp. tessellarius]UKF34829.1 hypothetical protein FGG90_13080 [Clavibacter michiganensis subsp. tessellarius]